MFHEWLCSINIESEGHCPEDLLDSGDVSNLNRWISRFVAEVRCQDGEPYPPRTIHQILAGLQRYTLNRKADAPKFLDRQNSQFRDIHRACDSVYRELHSEGVGTSAHHAPLITNEEEDKLWSSGVIGITTPKALLRAVFFYIGKVFCMRR